MKIPEVRERLENSTIPLSEKRMHNLKLLSWVEWWMETLNHHLTDVGERAVKLSQQLKDNISKNDGSLDNANSKNATRAVKDLGEYLKMSAMQKDPNQWVKDRVNFYAGLHAKGVMKFRTDDEAVPLQSSIRDVSEYRNYNERMNEYEKQYLKGYDPFVHNFLGIGDMCLRDSPDADMLPDFERDVAIKRKYEGS